MLTMRLPGTLCHCIWHSRSPGKQLFWTAVTSSADPRHERAAYSRHDWLAHYMLQEGTWNTPIILLDSTTVAAAAAAHGARLKAPFHLLEGHRRLAFLQGLIRLGKARPEHVVWLAQHGA
jgi:hypothetical protein